MRLIKYPLQTFENKATELHEACLKLQGTDVKEWPKLTQLVVDLFKKGSDLGMRN